MNRGLEAPHIVLLEDDHFAREDAISDLRRVIPRVRIEELLTEHSFRQRLPEFQQTPPDLFVLDMRVKWTVPSGEMPPAPEDVDQGGYQEAGYRCQQILAEDSRTAHVPIVIWTVLTGGEVDHQRIVGTNTRVITKTTFRGLLASTVKEILSP